MAKGADAAQPPVNPWDMQTDETSSAYHAFVCYRDLGIERSLPRAVTALGKRKGYVGQLERWSSLYQWVDRVRAWDAAEQQRKDAERAIDERRVWKEAQIKERDRRKAALGNFHALFTKAIQGFVKESADGSKELQPPDPESLRSIAGAFKTYMEQSRQEFNDLPTQKVAPVDARDPEGETPYAPRLDDFTSVITAVKELLESERGDDD